MPHLTRKEMEQAIKDGGSVLYNGQTLWKAEQLPSEADLAVGDPEAETAAANNIQQQIADLQKQIAKLAPTRTVKHDPLADTSGADDPRAEAKAKAKAEADAKAKASE